MIEFELTEEEVKMIELLRKNKKVDFEKLDKQIDEFKMKSFELFELATKLYDLYETNECAANYIDENLDYDLLQDIYEVGKRWEE